MAYTPFPATPGTGDGGGSLGPSTVGSAEIIDGSIVSIDIDSIDVSKITGLGALATLNAVGSGQITDGSIAVGDLSDTARRRLIPWRVTSPTGDALVVGDDLDRFIIPQEFNGWDIVGIAAAVTSVSTSGIPTIQVARVRSGTPVDVLSTRVTIDANELTSYTAATPAVINTSNDDLATGDYLRCDIDVAGTGAKGLHLFVLIEP